MQTLDVLTINEETKSKERLLNLLWEAIKYFPRGIWGNIEYLGNVTVKHDLKIKSKKNIYEAFIFKNLLRKIKELKTLLRSFDPLLGITSDPVVAIYHRFEMGRLERIVNLVHDYVSRDVGFISSFKIDEEEDFSKVMAHGLGHNRGLRHHNKPVDLMYNGLFDSSPIKEDHFCEQCILKLKSGIN